MKATIVNHMAATTAAEWNHLAGSKNPFIRYEFLSALEKHHCVDARFGWIPQHILVHDEGKLVGAVPMYLKTNSYGEFVFDGSWAQAYEQYGMRYYPKLVVAIPYTPVTGHRLLTEKGPHEQEIKQHLITAALAHVNKIQASSLHWLFTNKEDTDKLKNNDLMVRSGYQFHWQNSGYTDFNEFLTKFTAQKRKKIKRERRRVKDAGISIKILKGDEITEKQWIDFYRFYRNTFLRLGGTPTLSLAFFQEIGQTMSNNVVLMIAQKQHRTLAAAFNMQGEDVLYGRHWGCDDEYHSLHFEACYYSGIEYCIDQKLKSFEPGAQGEYKISRGFSPVVTESVHWIAHTAFKNAISDFITHEKSNISNYIKTINKHIPYKPDSTC